MTHVSDSSLGNEKQRVFAYLFVSRSRRFVYDGGYLDFDRHSSAILR